MKNKLFYIPPALCQICEYIEAHDHTDYCSNPAITSIIMVYENESIDSAYICQEHLQHFKSNMGDDLQEWDEYEKPKLFME
jgi:hypothetical protein